MPLEWPRSVALPETGLVEIELLLLLKAGRAATAQECYAEVAARMMLTSAQLHARIHNSKSEYGWHVRVRTARKQLVEKGDMYQRPFNTWRLTPKGLTRAAKVAMLREEGLSDL